ncbi:MAG: ABC-2 family transporter protein [Nanoarchaeota archaeon]
MNRTINYLKENVIILFKTTIEYKANFYTTLIDQILYFFVNFIFIYVFSNLFGDIIGWSLEDFILFAVFLDLFRCFAGIFTWKYFPQAVLNGDLNQHLVKPMGVFKGFYLSKLSMIALLYVISDILLLIIFILFLDFNFTNFYLTIFISLILIIFYLLAFLAIDSFSLLKDKLTDPINEIYFSGYRIFQEFPAQFFNRLSFKNIFLIYPTYFVSLLLIPVIRGHELSNFSFNFILLLLGVLILFFITWINWKIGLKRYEAFN